MCLQVVHRAKNESFRNTRVRVALAGKVKDIIAEDITTLFLTSRMISEPKLCTRIHEQTEMLQYTTCTRSLDLAFKVILRLLQTLNELTFLS